MRLSIRFKLSLLVVILIFISTVLVGIYLTSRDIDSPSLLRTEFILILGSTLFVTSVIAYTFAQAVLSPIDKLTKATQIISQGNFGYRIKKESSDEVGKLVDAFNTMLDHLNLSQENETRSTQAAEQEKAKADLIINSMADAVIVIDPTQKILFFNRSAEEMFELSTKKTLGRRLLYLREFSFLDPEHFTKKSDHSEEITLPKTNRVLKIMITPLLSSKSERLGTVLVFEDITKRKEMDAIKDEFVSTVGHELRTPLTSIKGYSSLLAEGRLGKLTGQQQRAATIIDHESDRLNTLINDILDLSKLEHGKIRLDLSTLNLSECIENNPALGMIEKRNLKLTVDLPKTLPKFVADKTKLTRVFTNLLSNAAKFTDNDGNISIVAREKKDHLVISIKDSGVGIPKKHLPHIFEKFYQVEHHLRRGHGGTGLGLPIVKQILDLHQSKISVQSKVGNGTTVTFTLPLDLEKRIEKESKEN